MDNMPVNLFDVALVAILVAGVLRGRKNGMSEELLSLLKWVTLVALCALAYEPVGNWLADSSPFSHLSSFVMAYVAIALVILSSFAGLKKLLGGKLLGSDLFGKSEYYLGMASGLVRFTCVLLAALALLNARYFSPHEVDAMTKFQNDVYGSNFFPTFQSVQATIFEKSLTGPWIKDHLSFLLIKPTPPENKAYKQKEYQMPL